MTIVEGLDGLLPREEPEASAVITDVFEREGIDVRTGNQVERVEPLHGKSAACLHLAGGGTVEADRVLVAVGHTFTDPEVARVGVAEADVVDRGGRVAYVPMTEVDRAIAAGATDGFVKLIAAPRRLLRNTGGGRLVGATIVAARGGELVNEAALAVRTGMFVGPSPRPSTPTPPGRRPCAKRPRSSSRAWAAAAPSRRADRGARRRPARCAGWCPPRLFSPSPPRVVARVTGLAAAPTGHRLRRWPSAKPGVQPEAAGDEHGTDGHPVGRPFSSRLVAASAAQCDRKLGVVAYAAGAVQVVRAIGPLALVLLVSACAGGDGRAERQRAGTPRPPTSKATPGPTTAPPTTMPPATSAAPAEAPTVPPSMAGAPAGDPTVVVTPTGVVAPVLGRVEGGWRVRTPCGAEAVVPRATPVGPAAVVLDPGHGGDERGAIGPGGLAEADVNLAVARHAARALEAAGFPAVLTRTADIRITLATRAEIIRALRPRAAVSIHHNADPDGPSARPGTETFYQVASADSKRLAGLVYEEVVRALSPYGVAWVADTDAGAKYRRNERGGDYYGILRRTAGVPVILAELAYVTNPPEAALLARPDVQRTEGEAVARGVIRFLTTDDPGSGFTEPYPRRTPAGPGGGAGGCTDPPLV